MERPILFSTEMVQAILQGRKSQTRRVVSPQPKFHGRKDNRVKIYNRNKDIWEVKDTLSQDGFSLLDSLKCPFGQVGDVLWVRESWNITDPADSVDGEFLGAETGHTGIEGDRIISWRYVYKASSALEHQTLGKARWKPSIHMPKEACRLKLHITNIKIERLQSISDSDSKAEGVKDTIQVDEFVKLKGLNWIIPRPFGMHQFSFLSLWCKIYGNDSWINNPWVWVIEFVKI